MLHGAFHWKDAGSWFLLSFLCCLRSFLAPDILRPDVLVTGFLHWYLKLLRFKELQIPTSSEMSLTPFAPFPWSSFSLIILTRRLPLREFLRSSPPLTLKSTRKGCSWMIFVIFWHRSYSFHNISYPYLVWLQAFRKKICWCLLRLWMCLSVNPEAS